MFVAGLAASAAVSAAQAQYAFPAFNPSPAATTTLWRSQDLVALAGGSIPAASYTSYLIAYDYTAVNGALPPNDGSLQWTNEGRSTLSTTAGSGTGSTPIYGAGNIVRASNTTSGPIGALASSITTPNLFWTGSLTGGHAGGSAPLFVNYRQTFGGTNALWSNVRVVLNPVVNVNGPSNVVTGPNAPASFTDLGQIDAGGPFTYNSPAVVTSAAAPLQWFRFSLGNSGNSIANFLLDLDTNVNANSTSTDDSEIHIFYRQSNGQLALVGTDDDDANGNLSLLTFGATSTTAGTRPYGAAGSTYDGRDGFASLFNAGEYFVAVGQFGGVASGSPSIASSLGLDGVSINRTYSFSNTTLLNPTAFITTQFNLNFVPTPGAAALLGLGGLVAARRRRA
ncbi:MAG: hypothetical protein MUE97_02185 [Phycisphaerales bacterium]|nr:hypothetical protein [Phycisphaerales bacterium]